MKKNKTCVVFHDVDLDGWMSAAIVKHWFIEKSKFIDGIRDESIGKELDFIGYNYGQPIPDLSEYDEIIMCDISFPKEEMEKLMLHENGMNKLTWIDHHISAIKSCEELTIKGLQNTKFAACELTWLYFMTDINKLHFDDEDVETMPEIVRLLGLYDSFRHKNTDEETKVLEFQYGARAYIKNYEDAYEYLLKTIGTDLNSKMTLEFIHTAGKSIYKFLCIEAKQAYKNGFEVKLVENVGMDNGPIRKFICINKERFNPINFGIDYHSEGYDGCACFHYANGMWNFSLYNDNGLVDCSTIAKQFGGGGHFSASGFRCDNNTFLQIISK